MNAVEQYSGVGDLLLKGEAIGRVGYSLTRYQGQAGNGMPVPGLFKIEGALEFGAASVPEDLVGVPLTLRLEDGRALAVTLADRSGAVLSQGHGPQRCLCC